MGRLSPLAILRSSVTIERNVDVSRSGKWWAPRRQRPKDWIASLALATAFILSATLSDSDGWTRYSLALATIVLVAQGVLHVLGGWYQDREWCDKSGKDP